MRTLTTLALPLVLSLAALASPSAQADSLSAGAADEALHQGARAWDVRQTPAAGLPGALRVEPALLDAWLAHGDLAALQTAISRAGIDLSRDVVVYGEAGDARAQALVTSLQAVSPGRVHWLVGGATEWSMSGRSLVPFGAHLPVPQRLAVASTGNGHMASASLRGVAPAQVLALR